ncbi:MAG: S1C family serine protease [Acidimicrobiales bacterium]|jgi:S1-C subfamily serine protease
MSDSPDVPTHASTPGSATTGPESSDEGVGAGHLPPGRDAAAQGFPYLAAVAIALVAVVVGVTVGHLVWTSTQAQTSSGSTSPSPSPTVPGPVSTSPGTQAQNSSASGAPSNAATLAKETDPAVVDIDTTLPYQAEEAAGTGMVISSRGEILTNNHVIEDAGTVSARDVGNGRTYRATVVGYDSSLDVAVLQLKGASGLDRVTLGNSSTVSTGDGVVAVGNAEGVGGTPSYAAGSISGIDRSISAQDQSNGTSEELTGLFATNAQIVPGYSGGPLVDSAGRVIGMVTAGSESYQFQTPVSEGFAIPVDRAVDIADQVEAGHSSSTIHLGPTPFLGVLVQGTGNGTTGAGIVGIVAGSPAAGAGLAPGDTIVAIAGHAVTSPESLTTVLLGLSPGTSVSVTYLDPSGLTQAVTVRLTSGPPQ